MSGWQCREGMLFQIGWSLADTAPIAHGTCLWGRQMAAAWAGPQATQGRMAALAGSLEAARAEAGECRAAADAQRQAAAEASSRAGRLQDQLQAATAASALAASGRDQVQPFKARRITGCTHASMPPRSLA